MKIGILGSKGFVGRNLLFFLSQKYEVVNVNRDVLDLLDIDKVKEFLKLHKFDVIINCAATMTNTINDLKNNLGLYMNFYTHADLFGKFINTASAAEYDRQRNISLAKEEEIWLRLPDDFYGLGQNLRSRLSWSKDNFYNLRIFNCFGPGELDTRIFPRILNSKEPNFKITDNRYFDYFSIADLCKVVDFYINYTIPDWAKDINCVYPEKYLISDVIDKFNQIHNLNKNIEIHSSSDKNYTGNAEKLNKLTIALSGLDKALKGYL
jgi:GDP-L-fucose synthase